MIVLLACGLCYVAIKKLRVPAGDSVDPAVHNLQSTTVAQAEATRRTIASVQNMTEEILFGRKSVDSTAAQFLCAGLQRSREEVSEFMAEAHERLRGDVVEQELEVVAYDFVNEPASVDVIVDRRLTVDKLFNMAGPFPVVLLLRARGRTTDHYVVVVAQERKFQPRQSSESDMYILAMAWL